MDIFKAFGLFYKFKTFTERKCWSTGIAGKGLHSKCETRQRGHTSVGVSVFLLFSVREWVCECVCMSAYVGRCVCVFMNML